MKGAPAAALYGSQAGNGVILITTKKGKSQGQRSISFSTSLMFDKAVSLPEMQNRYGVSEIIDSWGERQNLPKYDNLKDFFSTGMTSITSVSLSHGNEKYKIISRMLILPVKELLIKTVCRNIILHSEKLLLCLTSV